MSVLVELLASLFLIAGGVFALTGTIGLVKLRTCIQRLHAPTKAATLGVWGVLIASSLVFTLREGALSFHELLIALFILVTAPITANVIAKVSIVETTRPEDLPGTGSDYGWAIHDDPPEQ